MAIAGLDDGPAAAHFPQVFIQFMAIIEELHLEAIIGQDVDLSLHSLAAPAKLAKGLLLALLPPIDEN